MWPSNRAADLVGLPSIGHPAPHDDPCPRALWAASALPGARGAWSEGVVLTGSLSRKLVLGPRPGGRAAWEQTEEEGARVVTAALRAPTFLLWVPTRPSRSPGPSGSRPPLLNPLPPSRLKQKLCLPAAVPPAAVPRAAVPRAFHGRGATGRRADAGRGGGKQGRTFRGLPRVIEGLGTRAVGTL